MMIIFFMGCETKAPDLAEQIPPGNEQESVFPCIVPASLEMEVTTGQTSWPQISPGELLKINSLTSIFYPASANQLPNSAWGIEAWWRYTGNDPWSNSPEWGDNFVDPEHHFTDDHLRWQCGYSYVVEVPEEYDPSQEYPVVIFLHGSAELDGELLNWYHNDMRNSFHHPSEDPFIYVAPIKLEIDWDAKKVQDVLEDVKANMTISQDRVYLTGLSMGGRGTFIVAAELPETFAAIMPLSPHHEPYSYVPLAESVAHLPIWMMHGTIDATSSYQMATDMAEALGQEGANVEFHSQWGPEDEVGHWGWEYIYGDSSIMEWLLSWERDSAQ